MTRADVFTEETMKVSTVAEHGAERRQNVERLIAQRDDVRLAGLHALRRNRPARGGEVDFLPCGVDKL